MIRKFHFFKRESRMTRLNRLLIVQEQLIVENRNSQRQFKLDSGVFT